MAGGGGHESPPHCGAGVHVVLVPHIAPTLIAAASAAPVGGRNPTAPLVGCRRSTLVAESLRQFSVPVAPGPIAPPSPPAAPGARVEPSRPQWSGAVVPKTRLLQRIVHRRRAEQGIAADEPGWSPASRQNSGVRRGKVEEVVEEGRAPLRRLAIRRSDYTTTPSPGCRVPSQPRCPSARPSIPTSVRRSAVRARRDKARFVRGTEPGESQAQANRVGSRLRT